MLEIFVFIVLARFFIHQVIISLNDACVEFVIGFAKKKEMLLSTARQSITYHHVEPLGAELWDRRIRMEAHEILLVHPRSRLCIDL